MGPTGRSERIISGLKVLKVLLDASLLLPERWGRPR